jgi:hypothetical protein
LLIADCGLSQVELAIGLAMRAEKRRSSHRTLPLGGTGVTVKHL